MLDVIHGFLLQSAVIVPVLMLLSVGAWVILRKLRLMRLDEPFDAADMRTWPLAYTIRSALSDTEPGEPFDPLPSAPPLPRRTLFDGERPPLPLGLPLLTFEL